MLLLGKRKTCGLVAVCALAAGTLLGAQEAPKIDPQLPTLRFVYEEVVTLEIPQEFEQFAPQVEGMEYQIPCHARIGGVAWYYPLAAVAADGSS